MKKGKTKGNLEGKVNFAFYFALNFAPPLMRKSGNLGGKVKGKVNITTYVTSNITSYITSSPGRAAVKIRVGNTKRPLFVRAKAQPKFPDLTLPTTVVVEMPRSGKPGAFRVFKNSVRRGLFRKIVLLTIKIC